MLIPGDQLLGVGDLGGYQVEGEVIHWGQGCYLALVLVDQGRGVQGYLGEKV